MMRAIYSISNIAFICVMALALFIVASFGDTQESYAVVVDGGSTGSRIFIFKFSFENGKRRVTPESSIKLSPGMSSYANNPDEIVEYFAPALIQAAALIPENQCAQTELYIKATAGMRLIGEKEEQTLWSTLIQGLSAHSEIPFIINPKNFGTIDGYSEGYYAVIASNYITGRIDGSLHPVLGQEMLGAMDMVTVLLLQ
jgi:Golgi nucleoside diphosphatase